jgi:hypothetical protein
LKRKGNFRNARDMKKGRFHDRPVFRTVMLSVI